MAALEQKFSLQMKVQTDSFASMQTEKLAEDTAARLARQAKDQTKENKVKTFGDLLKRVLFNMPNQITEIPVYFDTIDRIFLEYNVPDEIKVNILNPYLSLSARKLVTALPAQDLVTYEIFNPSIATRVLFDT